MMIKCGLWFAFGLIVGIVLGFIFAFYMYETIF